ncbi:PQ loop repeat domain-containing protein [Trichoderma ceciliae]
MAPPTQTFNLDVEAISGICGSISIACWVVVFSPQIIQNFQRSSADALSIQFIIAWLLGDVFNILGAILQGVLPTMIILAIYYTIADLVLLGQLFYYRGFTWRDEPTPSPPKTNGNAATSASTSANADEYTALIARIEHHGHRGRRGSDWSGFSPAVPHLPEPPRTPQPPPTALQTVAWNSVVIIMVIAAGVTGWFLGEKASNGKKSPADNGNNSLEFNTLGQVFGYICAALYIASRLPQLILNWRRKTTEGLSMLFFLFACLGNATYVLSIVVYEPRCGEEACEPNEARRLYGRYILVNLSWLAGSAITLLMDFGVFAQYFMYRAEDDVSDDETRAGDEHSAIDETWDHRPLLDRGD